MNMLLITRKSKQIKSQVQRKKIKDENKNPNEKIALDSSKQKFPKLTKNKYFLVHNVTAA